MKAPALLRHLPAFRDTEAQVHTAELLDRERAYRAEAHDVPPAPAEACTHFCGDPVRETLRERVRRWFAAGGPAIEPPDRLPRKLNLRFWATVNVLGFAGYALIVWGVKP